jgi:hypothetical protein
MNFKGYIFIISSYFSVIQFTIPHPNKGIKKMRNEFLAFSKPSINEEEIAAVADVLRSGWNTTGQKNCTI